MSTSETLLGKQIVFCVSLLQLPAILWDRAEGHIYGWVYESLARVSDLSLWKSSLHRLAVRVKQSMLDNCTEIFSSVFFFPHRKYLRKWIIRKQNPKFYLRKSVLLHKWPISCDSKSCEVTVKEQELDVCKLLENTERGSSLNRRQNSNSLYLWNQYSTLTEISLDHCFHIIFISME